MKSPAAEPLLRGIIPPLVSPLAELDRLDYDGLERLVEHVLGGGVHGLFVLGTTGEAPSLSHRLRCELIERVADQVAGRVPMVVGVTDTSLAESLQIAEHAADHGAAAVVLAPPYYFPAGQAELWRFVERLAEQSPLPLVLYNMPSHTKLSFEPATIARAVEQPRIIGLKDSSGSMVYFHQVRRLTVQRSDFSLLVGPEELLAEAVLLGGDGGVCGGANLAPRLYVELYEAARAGDLAKVRSLHERVMRLSTGLYSVAGGGAAVLGGLKTALSLLGICSDLPAEPFARFGDAQRQRVAEVLRELAIQRGTAVGA